MYIHSEEREMVNNICLGGHFEANVIDFGEFSEINDVSPNRPDLEKQNILVEDCNPQQEYFGRAGWLDTYHLLLKIGEDKFLTPAIYVQASKRLTFLNAGRNSVKKEQFNAAAYAAALCDSMGWDY